MNRAVERRAAAAAERAAIRLAERLRAALPGVAVETGTDAVRLSGRALRKDPRLRWIGGWLR